VTLDCASLEERADAGIVALGISVWAVLRATSADRRRDRLQSRGIAVAVYPEILKLEVVIQNTRGGLRALKARDSNLVGQSVAWSVQQTGHVQIPPMLDRNVDRLFMLGDAAGPACLQLVNVLLQHNALVEEIAARHGDELAAVGRGRWSPGKASDIT
jgi:hypothetical protein